MNVLFTLNDKRMLHFFFYTDIFAEIYYFLIKNNKNIYILYDDKIKIDYLSNLYPKLIFIKKNKYSPVSKLDLIFSYPLDLNIMLKSFRKHYLFRKRMPLISLKYIKNIIGIMSKKHFREILNDISPYMIFLTSPTIPYENLFAEYVYKYHKNIKIFCGTDGWDNYYYYKFNWKANYYLAWGYYDESLIKQKYRVSNSNIVLTGIPYQKALENAYNQFKNLGEKDKIFGKGNKVIFFSSNNKIYIGDSEEMTIKLLIRDIKLKKLPWKILIRKLPSDASNYEEMESYYKRIKILGKDIVFFWDEIIKNKNYKNQIEQWGYLYNLVDVNVNLLSMAFLEARICNIPCISYRDKNFNYPINNFEHLNYQMLLKEGLIEAEPSVLSNVLDGVLNNKEKYLMKNFVKNFSYREKNVIKKLINCFK